MSYKDIKSFEQECKEKDAEIERLKGVLRECEEIMDLVLCEVYVHDHCMEDGRLERMNAVTQHAREAAK